MGIRFKYVGCINEKPPNYAGLNEDQISCVLMCSETAAALFSSWCWPQTVSTPKKITLSLYSILFLSLSNSRYFYCSWCSIHYCTCCCLLFLFPPLSRWAWSLSHPQFIEYLSHHAISSLSYKSTVEVPLTPCNFFTARVRRVGGKVEYIFFYYFKLFWMFILSCGF